MFTSIKVDKSPELVGTYPRFLKEAREKIARALTQIFVSSLAKGEIPNEWRLVNVISLFMQENGDNPVFHRPVSLTSMAWKL